VVQGFRTAYTLDYGYRVAHHTPAVMPPGGSGGKALPFVLPAGNSGEPVLLIDEPDLKISAFRVNHAPVEPAVGYRFDYKGRSVVISGDTQKTDSLVNAAKDVDLLIHEALQPAMVNLLVQDMQTKQLGHLAHIMQDIPGYHTTPEEAAQQASAAHAKQLVFSHIVPPLPLRYAYPAFVGDAAKYFSGPITVGEDGLLLSLPAGSTEITQRALK
jgi:ribonuclease Z